MTIASSKTKREDFIQRLVAITWQLSAMQREIDDAVFAHPRPQDLGQLVRADVHIELGIKELDQAITNMRGIT